MHTLEQILFERIEEGLETITFTRKQLKALADLKRFGVTKQYYALSVVSCYIGNRSPFYINRQSDVFKDRCVSERQVRYAIDFLRDNEFIVKIRDAQIKSKCAEYIPMTPGFFKWFRRFLDCRLLFSYLDEDDDYEPYLTTRFGKIDMVFIQSLQESLNYQIMTENKDLDYFPLINFTIREKDQNFMLLYGNGSGRASSDYANEKSEENTKQLELITRQRILANKWKCDVEDIREYDVTASVPTIARFFNKGKWETNFDFYEYFFKDILCKKYGLEWNKEVRKDCKLLFMLLAFNPSDPLEHKLKNINYYIKCDTKMPIFKSNNINFDINFVETTYNRITKCCGYIPNNIFINESCLYLTFIWVLRNNYGYFPKNHIEFVYDAIETDEEINKEHFDEILKNVAIRFKGKFMNHRWNNIPFTLEKVIQAHDYEVYLNLWNTTKNHHKAVFGDPSPINEDSIKILDDLFHQDGRLSKLYFRKGVHAAKRRVALLKEKNLTAQDLKSDKRSLGIDKQSLGKDLQSLGLDKQSLGIDKQSLGIDKQSLGIDKQSLGIDKQSLGQDLQSLGLDKQSLRLDLKSLGKDKQSIERKLRENDLLSKIPTILEENPNILMKDLEKILGISKSYRQKLMKILKNKNNY